MKPYCGLRFYRKGRANAGATSRHKHFAVNVVDCLRERVGEVQQEPIVEATIKTGRQGVVARVAAVCARNAPNPDLERLW